MGAFGGWDMPIQYAGILAEHAHTRSSASLFDISHMGEFEVRGPQALADLERLLTCSIATMQLSQVRYGYLLDQQGGVVDDLTCYRLGEDRFLLVVNAATCAGDFQWIQEHLSEDTLLIDHSAAWAKLDLQGPKSRDVLQDVMKLDVSGLGYFRAIEVGDTLISRTGYTGELGYEIYLPQSKAADLWTALLTHADCLPAGLGARDTLRLEMGYPLYGHELSEAYSPVGTAGSSFIDLTKTFIGKERVERDLATLPDQMIALKFDTKKAAREGDQIFCNDQLVGEITSGSLSPSLQVAIAMGRVKGEEIKLGQIIEVAIRNKRIEAEVVRLPFYTDGTARR